MMILKDVQIQQHNNTSMQQHTIHPTYHHKHLTQTHQQHRIRTDTSRRINTTLCTTRETINITTTNTTQQRPQSKVNYQQPPTIHLPTTTIQSHQQLLLQPSPIQHQQVPFRIMDGVFHRPPPPLI